MRVRKGSLLESALTEYLRRLPSHLDSHGLAHELLQLSFEELAQDVNAC